jgi:hypothetical protein
MSTTLRLTAAAAAVAGIAALNPLSAQAKAVTWYDGGAMTACFDAPGAASTTVTRTATGANYTFKVTGDVRDFEYRVRYGVYDAKAGKMVFSKSRNVDPNGLATSYAGSVSGNQLVLYRMDIVVPANEVTGAPALAYTSDPLGCD